MKKHCPYCSATKKSPKTCSPFGSFYRKSQRRWIRRFRCKICLRTHSNATFDRCAHQNKRYLNKMIRDRLVAGDSQRRIARILKINRKTVARKLTFLGLEAFFFHQKWLKTQPIFNSVQFDDLETFEHTKMKPLSVTMMVTSKSRKILGFEIARMPAKGLLAKKALKKYGYRKDLRKRARDRLFESMKNRISKNCSIRSDQNPHYPESVKKHFPEAKHATVKGVRGAITGQGELKAIGFDPLFSLNHSFAMLRYNISRLIRKTWCTTKKPEYLWLHIMVYVAYHNQIHLKKN